MIYTDLTQLIGYTPLLELNKITNNMNLKARVLAKLESFNPGGSVKDRVALSMIEAAEVDGRLKAGGTIIEPTSGNTGVGLAWVASVKGYHVVLTMPESMSVERRNLLKAFGATLVLTPASEGMSGAIRKAEELCKETEGAVILQQFSNPANPEAHRKGTAEEILFDTEGKIDTFVACVGTGGTLCGTAKSLKLHNPKIEVVAVEPDGSAVLSGDKPGVHGIQGIGAGFIPKNYNNDVVDRIVRVTDKEAMVAARMFCRSEGLLVGISSGAALHAAIKLARQPEYEGKTIVTVLPDTGERYLSTSLFG